MLMWTYLLPYGFQDPRLEECVISQSGNILASRVIAERRTLAPLLLLAAYLTARIVALLGVSD